jgi:DNA-binding GntR family transcriptional regulator
MFTADDPITVSAEVYAVMRRRILRGDLAMGEVISRRRIAADLSTSMQTVTAALLRLECEGFLEHRARSGTRIPIPSPDDVRGHYVVLEALEVQAVTRAAETTRRERADLEKLAKRVDELADQGDRQAWFTVHHRLHMRLIECSRSPVLESTSDRAYALAGLWLASLLHAPPFDTPGRHQEFIERILTGDQAAAVQTVREHLAGDLERTLDLLDRSSKALRQRRERFRRAPGRPERLRGVPRRQWAADGAGAVSGR